jgi:hypothetical protein
MMEISRLYLTFTAIVLAVLFTLTVGLCIVALPSDPAPDPFSPYADLLNGTTTAGLVCTDATLINDEMGADAARQVCTASPIDALFSHVQVVIEDNWYQVVFTSRGETLTIGALARLWGRRQVGSAHRGRMTLQWPAPGITAVISIHGQFSYFLPIERIAFTARGQGFVLATLASTLNTPQIIMPPKIIMRLVVDTITTIVFTRSQFLSFLCFDRSWSE